MAEDDIAYFQSRPADEGQAARAATHPSAAEVHRELALRYLKLARGTPTGEGASA